MISPTEREALGNMDDAFHPETNNVFAERDVWRVYREVLPKALEAKDVTLIRKCEQVLAVHGLAMPNTVSGYWEELSVPRNELQLRELYAHRLPEYGFKLICSHEEFPDWLLRDEEGNFLYTEVEHRSSHFSWHAHDPKRCDMIVCWEHDWKDSPLPVLEMFSGALYQPETPAPKASDGRRARLGVNFAGRLKKYRFGEKKERNHHRKAYCESRYKYLVLTLGFSDRQAVRDIAMETGMTSSAVYERIAQLRRPEHKGRGRATRKASDEVRDRVKQLMEGGATKSDAMRSVAKERKLKLNTVQAYMSPSRDS